MNSALLEKEIRKKKKTLAFQFRGHNLPKQFVLVLVLPFSCPLVLLCSRKQKKERKKEKYENERKEKRRRGEKRREEKRREEKRREGKEEKGTRTLVL